MKRIINGLISFTNNIYNYIILKYRHVTIGANSKINGRVYCVSNSKQGKRSTMSTYIVTKDIPSDELWAGNPAKFIRKL